MWYKQYIASMAARHYKLIRGVHYTSEKRPIMWVRVDGDDKDYACFERRGSREWKRLCGNGRCNQHIPFTDEAFNKLWLEGEAEVVDWTDPIAYARARQGMGVSEDEVAWELSLICSVPVRIARRWMDGWDVPSYATRLLSIWADSTPEQRELWFSATKDLSTLDL